MPRYEAGSNPEAKTMKAMVRRLEHQPLDWALGMACAFDTDEKWLEVYIMGPSNTVLMVDGRLHKAKIYVDYDIVDKETGEILYSVRQ